MTAWASGTIVTGGVPGGQPLDERAIHRRGQRQHDAGAGTRCATIEPPRVAQDRQRVRDLLGAAARQQPQDRGVGRQPEPLRAPPARDGAPATASSTGWPTNATGTPAAS